jgi:precorrin-3B methylase
MLYLYNPKLIAMQDNINSIINAIKIIQKENPQSEAIPLLEDALKQSMKLYVLNMASMSSVIDMEEIKENFKNGLELLEIFNKK